MADNRGPLIDSVSWALVSLSGAILGLRVYAKLSRHRGLWWDDYIALFSWFIQLACVILISINISHGFGKHASELKLTYPQVVQMSLRGAINGSLLILGAAWSKSSFAVTLLRMTKGGLKWSIVIVMATMNAFMKFKEKIGVGVAMSLGVFAAATGIVKTIKLNNLRNEDFSFNGGDLQIWSIVEIAMTLIAASIPVLRPFLRDAISSAGRYISADASDVRTDPYGRRKSQATTSTRTNTGSTPPRRGPSSAQRRPSQTGRNGTGRDLESGLGDGASDMSAELRKIINSDARGGGVAFNPTPSLDFELQDMSKSKDKTWLNI
ncbi:hypothetical protein PG993_004258 [Apiospora rasikravindrae]|uniref:Rhodopsin domain-containing protein n=1 Tax=Apiospora rasikravindrae TaxID=990691 RepID=A0ABR1TCA0_9PEZI